MTRRHLVASLILIGGSLLHAQGLPRPSVTDERVKLLVYSPNQVYKLVAYDGYQIDIQIGENEEIKTIAAGDSVGWQIVGSGQHVFIKPMALGARTNLSLVTNKRTYVFDLIARSPSRHEDITYLIRFRFVVGADGKESLVNYRMEGSYVVVERLGDFYTLRSGKESATAINQKKLLKDPS